MTLRLDEAGCEAASGHRLAVKRVKATGRLDALTSKRYHSTMDGSKRATIYFEADVHRALRLKAAAGERSISEVVNEAVRVALAEDAEDLAAFDERTAEKSVSFESFVRGLRQRGRI